MFCKHSKTEVKEGDILKEPKDLFGLIEEELVDNKKQEKPIILSGPIITQQEHQAIREANSIEAITLPKKKKKHFQYKDGKIQYMNAFSESLQDVLKRGFGKSERSVSLRNVAVIIIVFAIAFFFLAIKDGIFETSPGEKPSVSTGTTPKDDSGGNTTMTSEEIIESLQVINAKEIEKVEKYLDIKSNRVSTIAEITNAKRDKEELYLSFVNSAKTMTEDEFVMVENVIVRSVGMSKELLLAFEQNQGNDGIREILNKYTKGGN